MESGSDMHGRIGGEASDGTSNSWMATNEECAPWRFEVLFKDEVDRRKPIPAHVAKLLRRRSARLVAAADAVDAIEDWRDLRLIRKIVNDPEFLPGLLAQGLKPGIDERVSAGSAQ
jgi:hypothetical protein